MADKVPVPEMESARLADEALESLRKHHSGEMYECMRCYRLEPCPSRELVRNYDRLLQAESRKLDEAERMLELLPRLRAIARAAQDVIEAYDASSDEQDWTGPMIDLVLRRAVMEGRHYEMSDAVTVEVDEAVARVRAAVTAPSGGTAEEIRDAGGSMSEVWDALHAEGRLDLHSLQLSGTCAICHEDVAPRLVVKGHLVHARCLEEPPS